MTDVSIVIAAWNAEGFIAQAIADALAQAGVSLEVIVADDASPDATGAVVSAIGDPRVRYLRLPRNGGPAAARNAAFAAASGEWLMVLDADDRISPDRAATLLAAARKARADIVADNFQVVASETATAPRLHIEEALDGSAEAVSLQKYVLENELFGKRPPYGYLKPVFRRGFLRAHDLAYDEALRVGEDYDLVARALALGARFVRHRSAGYTYVTREGSISHRLSAANAWAMVAAEERFQREAAVPETLQPLLADRLSGLKDGAAFSDMVEALKRRDLGAFAGALARRPRAARHFAMPISARIERLGVRLRGSANGR
jgi:succinoglycan biosynthesis protein ExoO